VFHVVFQPPALEYQSVFASEAVTSTSYTEHATLLFQGAYQLGAWQLHANQSHQLLGPFHFKQVNPSSSGQYLSIAACPSP